MSKCSADVHAGRMLVPVQALTLSVAEILKDLDILVDIIYQLQNTTLQNRPNKV